jgi:hypothetical protein
MLNVVELHQTRSLITQVSGMCSVMLMLQENVHTIMIHKKSKSTYYTENCFLF